MEFLDLVDGADGQRAVVGQRQTAREQQQIQDVALMQAGKPTEGTRASQTVRVFASTHS